MLNADATFNGKIEAVFGRTFSTLHERAVIGLMHDEIMALRQAYEALVSGEHRYLTSDTVRFSDR